MTRKPARILTSSIAALSIPLIATLPQRGEAATIVWNSAASQSWQTAANWTGGVLPGVNDIASFAATGTATAIGSANNVSIQALQIQSTRTADLTIGNSSTTTNFTMTLAGATINTVANTVLSYERTGGTLNINNTAAGGGGTGRSFNVILANATDNIFNVSAGTVNMNTVIGQSAAGRNLTKDGAGVLVLTQANTFSGAVTVRNTTAAGTSTLRVQSSTGLGTGSTVNVLTGGAGGGQGTTLDLRNNITVAAGKTLTLNSNTTGDLRTTLLNGANNNAWNSNIVAAGTGLVQINAASGTILTIGGGVTSTGGGATGVLFSRGAGTVIYNGVLNMGTDRAFLKTDAGTVIVNSTGNSWLRTQVANGQIQIGANNALANVDFTFGENNGNNGRLELNGFSQTVSRLATFATSTGTNHILRNSSITAASTLTFATPTSTTDTLTNLQVQGTATGLGALHMVSNGLGRTEFNGGAVGADSWTVNSGTLAFTGTNNRILPGLVTGNASATIEKAGASTLTATNAWNNAGTTNLLGGTLVLGTGTAGAVNVSDGATLSTGLGGGILNSTAVTLGTAGATTYVPLLTAAGLAAPLNAASLSTAAAASVTVTPLAGAFTMGTYRLLDYAGSIGGAGAAGFALGPIGSYAHMTASLDTTTAGQVNLVVSAVDSLIWTGATDGVWDTNTTSNFALASSPTTGATFYSSDAVTFGDTADIPAPSSPVTNRTITGGAVAIGNLTFTNTAGNDYSVANNLTGAGGITKTGTGGLTLSGTSSYIGNTTLNAGTTTNTGTLNGTNITVGAGATLVSTGTITGAGGLTTSGSTTLRGPNTYFGATSVVAGTLELDHDGGTLTATSGVNVASGATLFLTRDGTATATNTAFDRALTGAGNLDANMRTAVGTTAADSLVLSADNSGFSGAIRLLSPAQGTYRLSLTNPNQPGTGTIEVQNGTQIFATGTTPYTNNISITGTGFVDSAGNIGALRIDGATWAGNINVVGAARIGSHNSTGTITGNISGGDVEFQRTNFNNNYTTILTGANTYGTTTIGGLNVQTAGTPSFRVNIGDGGTTGSLGTGAVTIHGDGANGVLGFDRSDGYTLAAGQTITGSNGGGTIADSIRRTFIDFDTTGTGFDNAGNAIVLGTITSGGQLRFGQARTNTITNLTGTITSQIFRVGSNAPAATVNLNNTAVVNVGNLDVGVGAAVNVANTLNINNGASLTATQLMAGQVSGGIGVINQATGSTVNVDTQLRVGHFPNNTSVYNMNGGSLTLTGASPNLTPSTAGGGGANATGDNNINGGPTATIHGGGIYLGNDGTGVMNHTGGTVTTNWIVLDNRGATGAGTNTPDGIDRYNISGSAELRLRSNWGLLGRNDGSYAVSLGGGTIVVDNTGTGTGTGANLTIPLDAIMDTVASTTTTFGTGGATNSFNLTKDITGTGTLALNGGGNINFTTGGIQVIAAGLSGANPIVKAGVGITRLSGANSGYTGAVTASAGILDLGSSIAPNSITLADGAGIIGEPATTTLNLGTATGGTVYFNPNTVGSLTATNLNVNANTVLDFSAAVPGDGTWTAITYGTKVGAGTFAVANAANYRSISVNDAALGGTAVQVTLSGTKAITWTGSPTGTWDINTTSNWDDDANPGNAEKFFAADYVTFNDNAISGLNVTVTPGVSPSGIAVSGITNNYTFTSTGLGIAGNGDIDKTGTTTLTLVGANTYGGKTRVGGGVVTVATVASLGNGLVGNSIVLSGGGKLDISANTATDLGVNRSIAVGVGGGGLNVSGAIAGPSANNTTTINYTIPGNISGSGPLSFSATGTNSVANSTALANYVLTGDNSAFTGPITIESTSSVMSQVTIANQTALPNTTSITLNYPVGAATNGNATTLTLNGVTLPNTMTLNLNAFATAANISQRSQITGTGNSIINGPIILTGTDAVGATAGPVVNFAPTVTGTSSITINGNITESGTGFGTAALRGQILFRSNGNTIINGTINLPNANFVRVDSNGITTVNSTGNVWNATDIRSTSTLRIGATNALPITAPMNIGQASDAGNSMFDLNGFDQQVAGLSTITGSGNNTRGVTNSSLTPSTLTINNATNFTFGNTGTNQGGNLTGPLSIVKNGVGIQTFAGPANTYTGNVTVNAGTLVAGGGPNSNALGSPTTAGRTVTVNNTGTTLSFTTNNVFGNGIGNTNLPAITINSGVLTSTRFNVLGPITLNGGTLTQASTDSGGFQGYEFLGDVTVGGAAVSTIETTNGKANHLATNTVFTVADATTGADLVVSAPLADRSNSFAAAAGGLTKEGEGTMELSGASTYTGPTVVNNGTLNISGSLTGSAVTLNGDAILGGIGSITGAVTANTGTTIAPGASAGQLDTGDLNLASGSALAIEVGGPAAATDYDQLNVTGTITLGGALSLDVINSYIPVVADKFWIGLNDSTDAVSGLFSNVPITDIPTNSGTVSFDGYEFTVYYGADFAGDTTTGGNDILVVVPEPGSAAMLLGGVAMLLGLQRRRRKA